MSGVKFSVLVEPAVAALVSVLAAHPDLIEMALEAAALGIQTELQAFIAKAKAAQPAP